MAERPLAGKKIAVLVETEYIPGEIEAYRTRFETFGAQVHFMSRLWNQATMTFVSDVDEAGPSLCATREKLKTMDVSIDFTDASRIHVEDYAAVLMAANYTSVRLRYFQPPPGQPVRPELARTAPAVQFFAKAMRNPYIVKGALCHALWILTPVPELLAGRRVICHEVVIADVSNAGGIYVPRIADGAPRTAEQPSPGVVVDEDLVTGDEWHVVNEYVDAIKDRILALDERARRARPHPDNSAATCEEGARPPAARHAARFADPEIKDTRKRILIVLSNHGYWGEELVGPVEVFQRAGYQCEFATPNGARPVALPPSYDPYYVDPALGRVVTTPEMARNVREFDDPALGNPRARWLDNPINLSAMLPERPYFGRPAYARALESYYRQQECALQAFDRFDALLLVGGSGPVVDMVNNPRIHDLILYFLRSGKPIAAECYAIGCLAFARDVGDRRRILRNKFVTGHCLEFDYLHDWGTLTFPLGAPPYPLEYILRDATAPQGGFVGNLGSETSVVVDYPFITGRTTSDGDLTGQKLVEVLENNLKRFGWSRAEPTSRS